MHLGELIEIDEMGEFEEEEVDEEEIKNKTWRKFYYFF